MITPTELNARSMALMRALGMFANMPSRMMAEVRLHARAMYNALGIHEAFGLSYVQNTDDVVICTRVVINTGFDFARLRTLDTARAFSHALVDYDRATVMRADRNTPVRIMRESATAELPGPRRAHDVPPAALGWATDRPYARDPSKGVQFAHEERATAMLIAMRNAKRIRH